MFATQDQKAITLVKLLVEEVIPVIGMPEALLSDRGTNLMSHLIGDICSLLGIHKLSTTTYHPQCDGLVEKFNRTLKTMLCKQAVKYGSQEDQFYQVCCGHIAIHSMKRLTKSPFICCSGSTVVWDQLLFGINCCSPSKAAFMTPTQYPPVTMAH